MKRLPQQLKQLKTIGSVAAAFLRFLMCKIILLTTLRNKITIPLTPDTINHSGIIGSIVHFSLLGIPIKSCAKGIAEDKAKKTVDIIEPKIIELAKLNFALGSSSSLAAFSCCIILKLLYAGGSDASFMENFV